MCPSVAAPLPPSLSIKPRKSDAVGARGFEGVQLAKGVVGHTTTAWSTVSRVHTPPMHRQPFLSGLFCVRRLLLHLPAAAPLEQPQQDALDAMTTDEAQLVSAVSMLKALGVEEESDIEVNCSHISALSRGKQEAHL